MFNLEKAVHNWKRSLRNSPAFEDGDIVELEVHLREEIDRLISKGRSEQEAFQTATEEIGQVESIGEELYKTRSTNPGALPPWKQKSWMPSLLFNYVRVAQRNLLQNKLYTGINILGLSVGIICCLLIYLFVRNELSYDTFHEKGDRIYRVIRVLEDQGNWRKVGITSAPFRDALANDFPGMVEMATHLLPSDGMVTVRDQTFREDQFYIADENFFQVFSWPLMDGDPRLALSRPNTVVLSEATAKKYFGSEDPVGKTIRVDDTYDFEVTGVFRKPEDAHSHVDFDLVASMATFRNLDFYTDWWSNSLHTYLLLAPNTHPKDLEQKLSGFVEKYFGENMARFNRRMDLELQPLREIYFADDMGFDTAVSHGSKTVVYMFGIIAFMIIAVACINFVNMATARSVNRSREIGIRKTMGAHRSNLMVQFLGEALLITFAAGAISLGVVYGILPWFEKMADVQIVIDLFSSEVIGSVIIFLLFTGLLAGSYPAMFLSSFEPVRALKEKISFGISQVIVRKGLIMFQFAISSLLIIGTLMVNKQLDYISGKSLGFQPDQLVNISINNGEIRPHLEILRDELERLPGIQAAGLMSGTPGGFFDNYLFRVGENWDETHRMRTLFTDYNFTEVLGLEMLAGRDFDRAYSTDSLNAVVINKEAAGKFGWTPEEALGQRFENQYLDSTARRVIGVVENFHYESLHKPIEPLVVAMNPDRREILVRLKTDDLHETLASIENLWQEFSPLYPAEYFFLNEQFAELYESDRRQRTVFTAFSSIAIILACLGLFSLAAFNAEKRRKEMGVRKVLGASFTNILQLFNKELFVLIGLAFIVAAPVAYVWMEQWLQDYAYRIPNGIGSYLLAGAIIVVLSLLTVSYQSLKVAKMNPVKSLRSD